jgi:hypothetical protein
MSRFTTIRRTRASIALTFSALLLAACGTYGPGKLAAGQSEADARAQLGEPTTRTTLPNGGTRLDYARGPYGKHTYRVVLDAGGTVTSVTQLLTEANFETLRPGWSQEQVSNQLGPPSETRGGWRGLGEVWSYRYDWLNQCRWFQVWLVDARVREAGYAPDPVCDEKRRLSGGGD